LKRRTLAMSAPRAIIPMMVAVSTMLTLLLTGLGSGCGPGAPEVDKAALYTPESLASELAFRFQALSPDAKTAAVRYRPKPKDDKKVAEQRARSEQAKNKLTGGAPARKKQTGPPSIDDLLADIDSKLDLIAGISRPDACRKMIETISGDASLPETDKKRLSELVGRIDGSH
jgi:hypothetical protein